MHHCSIQPNRTTFSTVVGHRANRHKLQLTFSSCCSKMITFAALSQDIPPNRSSSLSIETFSILLNSGKSRITYKLKVTKFRSTFAQTLDVWHLAEEFSPLPALNSTFIQSNTPIVTGKPKYFIVRIQKSGFHSSEEAIAWRNQAEIALFGEILNRSEP